MQADTLVTNCRIYTLWDRLPVTESMAIAGGRVVAVGPESMDYMGPQTRVVDLQGRTVVPGFIDSHNHMVDAGLVRLRSASLLGCRSIAEIIDRLHFHYQSGNSGPWLLGHCFDQEILAEGRFPNKRDLDKAFGDTPVLITRVCGHACVASSSVLKLIEGELPRSEKESGILTEGRAALAWGHIPSPSTSVIRKAARLAAEEARSRGITGIHCLVGGADEFSALQKLHENHELPVRIYAHIPLGLHNEAESEGLSTGSGDEWLKIGAVKIFMDGSMGARTAAMHDDFSDDPGNRGELLLTADELASEVALLQEKGFQAAVHAIGDCAVDQAVMGFEQALDGRDNRIYRHRIEHASIMTEFSLKKMAELNIIAAVQPQFVVSDFWTIDRVGQDRYKYAYPFKTMLRNEITLAMGSDCPVEATDPFQLLYRAVTRDSNSQQECLTPGETLKAYCLGSAYAAFEEDLKGSLQPGKLADFAVLSQDILAVDTQQIESTKVFNTCIGGRFYPEL